MSASHYKKTRTNDSDEIRGHFTESLYLVEKEKQNSKK